MNILAIDTSNQVLGIAVLKDDQIVGEIVTNLAKNHSVRLMPAIDRLMKDIDMTPDQLDKIVVAKGPGSYTGVRIGLTTAKSLAWALSIPIVGISSLEVLAYQGRFFDGYVCTFFDARREMVFTSLYKWNKDTLTSIYEETNISMKDWLSKIAEENKKVLFLSPDILLYKEMIVEHLGDLAVFPEAIFHIAKPSHLALAGMGKDVDDTHSLVPNYLRLAEAEANWIKAQGNNL